MSAITDDQLRAMFGRHCECRPLDLARAGDDHASVHDCDTGILFDIQIALAIWDATSEVRQAARDRCAALAIEGVRAARPCPLGLKVADREHQARTIDGYVYVCACGAWQQVPRGSPPTAPRALPLEDRPIPLKAEWPKLQRALDPRGPCDNEDCSRCHPSQQWFRVRTATVERRQHERKLIAASPDAALAEYAAGTAWPSDYDTRTLETLETGATVVEEIPSPWLHKHDDGTVIDVATCWWDLSGYSVSAGSDDDFAVEEKP